MTNQFTSQKLSLAIICLNEAANIERCLKSVPFASDVVVVDSGSIDQTARLAAERGARVFTVEWRGFREQKRHATELCQFDWVLSLDADEALSAEAAGEIERLLNSPDLDRFDAYDFPRLSWNLGRWIRHGGWYPDRQTRLFNRTRAEWSGGEQVHEKISAARVANLQHPILHWPFPDLMEQIQTNNRYSSLGANELHQRKIRFSLLKLIGKPISKFLETYVAKAGYRDGLAGFIIAVGAAYSVFLKFAKLWEFELSGSHKKSTEPEQSKTSPAKVRAP